MKLIFISLSALIAVIQFSRCASKIHDQFTKNFVGGYQALHMPDLELRLSRPGCSIIYGSPESIQKQLDFFQNSQKHNFYSPIKPMSSIHSSKTGS